MSLRDRYEELRLQHAADVNRCEHGERQIEHLQNELKSSRTSHETLKQKSRQSMQSSTTQIERQQQLIHELHDEVAKTKNDDEVLKQDIHKLQGNYKNVCHVNTNTHPYHCIVQ